MEIGHRTGFDRDVRVKEWDECQCRGESKRDRHDEVVSGGCHAGIVCLTVSLSLQREILEVLQA